MLRARFERVGGRIIGTIDRAEGPVPSDTALEFFARLLRDRFFERIGATDGQDRARDANGGRKGFQALRIMGSAIHCKKFGTWRMTKDECRMTKDGNAE